MSRRRWLVFAAATVAVAAPVGIALAIRAGDTFVAVWNVAALTYPAVGLLILWNRPRNGIGRLFLILGLMIPLSSVAVGYAHLRLPAAAWAAWLSEISTPVVFGSLLVFLPLLFPTGSPLSAGWRRFAIFAAGLLGTLAVLFALTPGPLVCCPGLRNPIDVPALGWTEQALGVGFPVVVVTGLTAFGSLISRYRRSRAEERLQIKWFTFAVAVLLLAAVVGALASLGLIREDDRGLAPVILFPTTMALIAVAVGVAILRHRLYDIDLVINKTLVYGVLAAFITAVYVGVVVGVGYLLGTRGEPNLALQLAATALVAVAFQPVRARVQRLANRLVYGERATPYEVMADFGGRIASSLRIEDVLPEIAEVAARGIGAVRSRVLLYLPGGATRAAPWPDDGEDPGYDLSLDVVHQGERVGEIAVAKAPGDPLRSQDEGLLRDVAAQTGLALHNVRLTAELQARLEEVERTAAQLEASRARLVSAEDRERRRIEAAIERGAERGLTSMLADLERIQGTVAVDPEGASRELERLGLDAGATLETLRDLARGIYPPLLADRGLAAALEAQARKTEAPVDLRTDGMGRYREEVEAGIYFCCLELLRDPGRGLRIDLEDREGRVHLRLERAGEPVPEAVVRIADRVEALDGTLGVDLGPPSTVISARVPTRSVVPAG
jgi:signal transduction histidine kinase